MAEKITEDKIYEEVGENYRFFAKWRQLAFAGYLAVMAATMSFVNSAFEHQCPRLLVAGCFFMASFLGVIFFFADRRTRTHTFYATKAGVAMEAGKPGFFTVIAYEDDQDDRKFHRFQSLPFFSKLRWSSYSPFHASHSLAAFFLFLGSAFVFFLFGIIDLCGGFTAASAPTVNREYKVVTSQGAVTNIEAQINQLGTNGWRVVTLSTSSEPPPAPKCTVILEKELPRK